MGPRIRPPKSQTTQATLSWSSRSDRRWLRSARELGQGWACTLAPHRTIATPHIAIALDRTFQTDEVGRQLQALVAELVSSLCTAVQLGMDNNSVVRSVFA